MSDKPTSAPPLRPGDRAPVTLHELAQRPDADQKAGAVVGSDPKAYQPLPPQSPWAGGDPVGPEEPLGHLKPARLPIGIYFHQLAPEDLAAMGPLTRLYCSIPGDRNEMDLVEQIVDFLCDEICKPDPMDGVRALQTARKTYRVLIGVGYRHERFLEIVEAELTKLAKWGRGEMVRRLLRGELTESQATEALKVLTEEALAGLMTSGSITESEAQAILRRLDADQGLAERRTH
jgi:hypothetical protein